MHQYRRVCLALAFACQQPKPDETIVYPGESGLGGSEGRQAPADSNEPDSLGGGPPEFTEPPPLQEPPGSPAISGELGGAAPAEAPGRGATNEGATNEGATNEPVSDAGAPPALWERLPIIFRSATNGEDGNLFLMRPDGSGIHQLTHGGGFFLPRWSPDGARVAFRHATENITTEVAVLSVESGEWVDLTEGEHTSFWSFAANWSADGTRLAYSSVRDPAGVWLWSVSLAGGQYQRMLVDVPGYQREAAWSRRSPSRIAFIDLTGTGSRDIFLIEEGADPATARNLTQGRVYAPTDVRWSPDDTRLAFTAFPLAEDGSFTTTPPPDAGTGAIPTDEVFVLDVESGELQRLTFNFALDKEPTWSPTGDALLITSNRGVDQDIWLIPLDDPTRARNLIDDDDSPRGDTSADWYWGAR